MLSLANWIHERHFDSRPVLSSVFQLSMLGEGTTSPYTGTKFYLFSVSVVNSLVVIAECEHFGQSGQEVINLLNITH